MKVDEHSAYQNARKLSSMVWTVSKRWDRNVLSMIGNQLIRAADSISANLAEGWNRYSKKDKINFYIIARASAAETSDWLNKALERNLIDHAEWTKMKQLIEILPKEINGLIKGTRQYLKK